MTDSYEKLYFEALTINDHLYFSLKKCHIHVPHITQGTHRVQLTQLKWYITFVSNKNHSQSASTA